MPTRPKAELWIKLSFPGIGQIGPGKMQLLRKISELQSIAAAARSMSMSYRRAWLLVDEMNGLFEQPVVAKWHGGRSKGGASLTDFGQKLIDDYALLVERSNDGNADSLVEISSCVRRDHGPKSA